MTGEVPHQGLSKEVEEHMAKTMKLLSHWLPRKESQKGYNLTLQQMWVKLPDLATIHQYWVKDIFHMLGKIVRYPTTTEILKYDNAKALILWDTTKKIPDYVDIKIEGAGIIRQRVELETTGRKCDKCKEPFHARNPCYQNQRTNGSLGGETAGAGTSRPRNKRREASTGQPAPQEKKHFQSPTPTAPVPIQAESEVKGKGSVPPAGSS
ncbi:hypothetical protein R1sor_015478 [Riccia sorocarpa]|uniref:DUF4283 domain-containing protein n=1 Tax=Riccia sorocarpa TaxID=122646 RepID=A0ABD3HG95_9MARC